MGEMVDAFWRALAYCLHPKVLLWSLLPLVLAGLAVGVLGWFWWETAVAGVRAAIEHWSLVAALIRWLDAIGAERMHALIAPLIVVALAVPAIVVVSLLLVAVSMTPAIVGLVAARRFPHLERKAGGGWFAGLAWSLACTAAALAALVLSVPLWFVPPFVVIVPPLVWGWLTCRVYAYDVLAEHASAEERHALMRAHRWPLLAMGIVCGYLGAAPSLLWAASAMTLVFAPLLVVVSVWLYTIVFAFAACWFAHYALAALDRRRRAEAPARPVRVLPPL